MNPRNLRKPLGAIMLNLTPSEFEVLKLITKGYKTKDIASERNVSTNTVKSQTKSIFQKMQVRNRAEAAIILAHLIKRATDGEFIGA